jgi:LysR family glycine cleavage system transcriptional activator
MPPRSPSLLALRAFETAARRLSFTEAARELHISQGAVSRHVRALEKDVGRELFRRLHRAVELTDAGRRFASELGGAFLQINRAVEAVRGVRAQRLRITAEPAFASRWLVPRLGGFSLAHPQIELEVETSDEFRAPGAMPTSRSATSVGAARPRRRATSFSMAACRYGGRATAA